MSIGQYLLLFVSVLVGGLLAFYLKRCDRASMQLVLSFSGAYVLGITVLHLLPHAFTGEPTTIGLWILGGFFIQLFLEQLSGGVEHGHIHPENNASPGFAASIMIGLCAHAFLEGMPLSHYHELGDLHTHDHNHGHQHYLVGIILHKLPAAFALVILLLLSGFRQSLVLICLLVFAAMSPLGALVAEQLPISDVWQRRLIALVIGSFLHISTTIIFESDRGHHRVSVRKLIAIVAGTLLAVFSVG